MYNVNQIITLIKLTGCALGVFVILNVAMWVSAAVVPSFLWVPKQFFGVDFVKENYQKVQGAKAYYRDPVTRHHSPLIVILGLSSASEGIRVQQLQENAQDRSDLLTRFLSLSGAGRNFKEIEIYAKPLIRSPLKPTLVILAINPFHLMDPPATDVGPRHVFRDMPLRKLLTGWFVTKRRDLRHIIDMKGLSLRTGLFAWFENRVDEKRIDPWKENTLMRLSPLQTPEQWQYRVGEYGRRGYYDLHNYGHSHQQIARLVRLLDVFDDQGVKVVIVLMPEHTSLYQRVPSHALQIVVDQLRRRRSSGTLPRIVDMRQSIPDSGFNDISHMNQEGREMFTNLLDALIQRERSPS